MRKRNALKWFYSELPGLVAKDIITEEAAEKIREYYGEVEEKDNTGTALVLLSAIGALLIGGGIILLLAHNWEELSRPSRTVITYIPLTASVILGLLALLKNKDSALWREPCAIFSGLSVAAAIALIGQTYNIHGDLSSYLFSCMALSLPTIYVFSSTGLAILYLGALTGWVFSFFSFWNGDPGNEKFFFYLFFGALLPFVIKTFLDKEKKTSAAWQGWAMAVFFTLTLGILIHGERDLWIIAYTGLYATLYLAGTLIEKDKGFFWASPLLSGGTIGLTGMAFILSSKYSWSNHYRFAGYFDSPLKFEITLTFLILAILVITATKALRRGVMKKPMNMIYLICPSLAFVCLLAGFFTEGFNYFAAALFNLYLLITGALIIRDGIRKNRLSLINAGMFIIILLAMMRFFDSSFSFVLRGMIFVCLGIGFFMVNGLMLRKRRKEAAQ